MGKGKYNRQVTLIALKTTAITDLLSSHPNTRKYTICCHYYSPVLYGFNHRKTVSPELGLSLHYMDWERKKRQFLLIQLTTRCCSNTLPQAMQPQLHHLPWKDSREEREAESATSWGSSITMTVLCYEFTWNLTSPVPVSCSQTPTLLNCYFWCALLYPDVFITCFSLSAGFICLSSV